MEKDELTKLSEQMVAYVAQTDPAKAAEMQLSIDNRHAELTNSHKRLWRQFVINKLLSASFIVLAVICGGIIFVLFTRSLFEGFVSLLLFIFLAVWLDTR